MRAGLIGAGFIALMLAFGPAHAQRVEGDAISAAGPYAAEVPVNNQTVAQRNNGMARALLKVLTNVTGDSNPIAREGVAEALRNASSYVSGYDYRQDEGTSSTGAPTFKTMLVVRFNESKVSELVNHSGLPVWPTPRPKPVLWMAIDDGSGPRLVGLPQVNAARPVLDRAKARGYRLGLPAGNAAEQAVAGAIWRGDTAAVARASQAYQPPMQLIGKVYRSGAGWKADWTFVDKGRVLARTSAVDGDARRAMAKGADIAGEALLRKYARGGRPAKKPDPAAAKPTEFVLTVSGIESGDRYRALINAIESKPGVKSLFPLSADGNSLTLEVGMVGGQEAFDSAVVELQRIDTDTTDEGMTGASYRLK
ncbi:DUF2066 domain-containing protein [Lysobacter sp. HDW10]|uniref:DUF2066 domain-containing protein n=1 Tax=Lysobacter sp. HDW10 TaxID=2714936 RepID=UPI0014077799|nr:DUF2066 domain-containing protein [Lysobacter sp. HDW10]QIK80276.1 DUF2066 domain-containing protein [Lysobacter sp. HDW10]